KIQIVVFIISAKPQELFIQIMQVTGIRILHISKKNGDLIGLMMVFGKQHLKFQQKNKEESFYQIGKTNMPKFPCRKCGTACHSRFWPIDRLCARCRTVNGAYYRTLMVQSVKRN